MHATNQTLEILSGRRQCKNKAIKTLLLAKSFRDIRKQLVNAFLKKQNDDRQIAEN